MIEPSSVKQFDFGENWREFSHHALTDERVAQAKAHFAELTAGIELKGKTFLDIGFGQGLSLLSAAVLGAEVTGCDINPKCGEVLATNRSRFPDLAPAEIPVVIGSILSASIVGNLKERTQGGFYDIVHSWGVLHHTGDMRRAVANAASLVRPGGHLIMALYNRHWTSPAWTLIKWCYVHCPAFLKKLMTTIFIPIIYLAKYAVTGENPKKQTRGMDFYYNVIDWVGGYPYEYASIAETKAMLADLGFACLKAVPAEVPTGCNEFVFVKTVATPPLPS